MEVNLGQFKYVFLLESLYGTTTVSLTSLQQSKWKVTYSVAFILIYVLEYCIYVYTQFNGYELEPNSFRAMRAFLIIQPMYVLTSAIRDYKSRISVALNLEAIEQKLKTNNGSVPGQSLFKVITWGLISAYSMFQIWGIVLLSQGSQDVLPLTRYLTTFQISGSLFVQAFVPIIFLTKVLMIQKGIAFGFSEIERQYVSPAIYNSSHNRRRISKEKKVAEEKWKQLTELQGNLYSVENTIRDFSGVGILLHKISAEVLAPMCLIALGSMHLLGLRGNYFPLYVLILISTVFLTERIKEAKRETLQAISRGDGAVSPTLVKHQILAAIHRDQIPFSCGVFDVEYGFLVDVFENMLFVVTTVISTLKSNN